MKPQTGTSSFVVQEGSRGRDVNASSGRRTRTIRSRSKDTISNHSQSQSAINTKVLHILQLVQNQLVEFLRQRYSLSALAQAFKEQRVKEIVQKHYREENILMVHKKSHVPLFRKEMQLIGEYGDRAVNFETTEGASEYDVDPDFLKIVSLFICLLTFSAFSILTIRRSKMSSRRSVRSLGAAAHQLVKPKVSVNEVHNCFL